MSMTDTKGMRHMIIASQSVRERIHEAEAPHLIGEIERETSVVRKTGREWSAVRA